MIFLPGIAEISTLFEALATLERPAAASASATGAAAGVVPGGAAAAASGAQPEGEGSGLCGSSPLSFKLFVLHSTIGREEQTEVFSPPPADTCHVVLASNIAESSLTLPKCRLVIDFCLRRQMIYDPVNPHRNSHLSCTGFRV